MEVALAAVCRVTAAASAVDSPVTVEASEAASEADLVVDSPVTVEDLVAAFRVTGAALVASEDLEGSEATVADLEDSTLSRL